MKKRDRIEKTADSGNKAYTEAGLGLEEAAGFHGRVVKKASSALEKESLKAEDVALIRLANDAIRERNTVCGDRAPRKADVSRKTEPVSACRKLRKDECI